MSFSLASLLLMGKQARERLTSYRAMMTIKICWTDTSGQQHDVIKDCGLVPIMVRVSVSNRNLII